MQTNDNKTAAPKSNINPTYKCFQQLILGEKGEPTIIVCRNEEVILGEVLFEENEVFVMINTGIFQGLELNLTLSMFANHFEYVN